MAGRLYVAIFAFALAGCAGPLPAPSPSARAPTPLPTVGCACTGTRPPDPVPTASGSRSVLLRLDAYIGAPLQGITVGRPALFSLYGDGRAIYVVGDGYRFELRHAQLSGEQVQALLSDALGPGGLAEALWTYDDVMFESTHVFEIHAEGITKQVTVIGLGFEDSEVPSAGIRAKLNWLAERLTKFDAEIAGGGASGLGRYEPEAYRGALYPPYVEDLTANADWPWPEVLPSELIPSGVLTAAQGRAVLDLEIGQNLIARGPDGQLYQITVRPLLPEEVPI